jgi:hypothetical protein
MWTDELTQHLTKTKQNKKQLTEILFFVPFEKCKKTKKK